MQIENREDLIRELDTLQKAIHAYAVKQDLGQQRVEAFAIYEVTRNLRRAGYAEQVSRAMNPLL